MIILEKKSENNIWACSFIWYQQSKSKFDYVELHFLQVNLIIQHKNWIQIERNLKPNWKKFET